MKHEITRQVVEDLWPLCQSGDASADSRALVDAFLAHDPAFAAQLKETKTMENAMPKFTLSPDTERRLLEEARSRARIQLLLAGGGLGLLFVALIGVMFKLL